MRENFKIASVYLLTLFMLISTVGFSINKMICLNSGKTTVAVFDDVKCPGYEEQSQEGIDERCCDFLSKYVQVDYFSTDKPVKIPEFKLALVPVLITFVNFPFPQITIHPKSLKGPPENFGIALLKLISVFRI